MRKNKRKVVVDLELLGKLPPLRSYMCPLFFEAVPDFGWTPAPSRPTFRPSELQRARETFPHQGGMALVSCFTCELWSRRWRYLQNSILERHHCLSCQPPISLLLLIGTYLVDREFPCQVATAANRQTRHQPKAQVNAPNTPRHPASVSLGTTHCAISQSVEVDVVLEGLIVTMAICKILQGPATWLFCFREPFIRGSRTLPDDLLYGSYTSFFFSDR